MSTRRAQVHFSSILSRRTVVHRTIPRSVDLLVVHSAPTDRVGGGSAEMTSMRPPRDVAELAEDVRSRLNDLLATAEMRSLTADKRLRELCHLFNGLCSSDKNEFLLILATEYGVNQPTVLHLAKNLARAQEHGTAALLRQEDRLRRTLIPRYQQLFTLIGHIEYGVKFLVDLRTHLLALLSSHGHQEADAHLQGINGCLRDLLSIWFSVGFLQLGRITWQSSCDMLQKISGYEAVHPIRNWSDLKRRVGPYRRCFVFTHKNMPLEPVIVLHTALMDGISDSIQSIVQNSLPQNDGFDAMEQEDPDRINTAIFYSITSTQKGLQGIEMGNYLIKSVVRELLAEFPRMQYFSSLSPIPGFRDWLVKEINTRLHRHVVCEEEEEEESELFTAEELSVLADAIGSPAGGEHVLAGLKAVLQRGAWAAPLAAALAPPLLRLCARYLYVEKRRGYACNPVAHFHLRNGAVLWRLNWLADTSNRGYSSSCAIMVNYRYLLDDTETNSKLYIEKQQVRVSAAVLALLPDTQAASRDDDDDDEKPAG